MNRHTLCALLCASAFLLTGCKVKRPSDIIAEDKMENIIYDYHVAKALGENLSTPEAYKRQLYIDAVFSKHGVTEEQFDSSLVWYTRNTEILSDIYERVTERLKNEQNDVEGLLAMRESKISTSVEGDSVNIWAWRKTITLGNEPMDNLFSFALDADTNFHLNDRFVMEGDFMLLDGKRKAADVPVLSLQLVYENDSVVGITRQIMKSGRSVITLGDDRIGRVKELSGFIYRPITKRHSGNVVVSNISLMRYHTNDTIIATADTLATDSLSAPADSVEVATIDMVDRPDVEQAARISPNEMNKRRSGSVQRVERPEQIEVEKKILDEKKALEQNNRRRKPATLKRKL